SKRMPDLCDLGAMQREAERPGDAAAAATQDDVEHPALLRAQLTGLADKWNARHGKILINYLFFNILRTCAAASARVPIHTAFAFFAICITRSNAHIPAGRPNTCA